MMSTWHRPDSLDVSPLLRTDVLLVECGLP